jgi:hypothetical protein
MQPIEYDPLADSYWTEINGQHVWCECPLTLEDILHRLDDREARREDARASWTALVLAAVAMILAAVVAAWL